MKQTATKKKLPDVIINNAAYSNQVIIDNLRELSIQREHQQIITRLSGKTICQITVSDNYGVFDFSGFVSQNLSDFEQLIEPETFSLVIQRGVQQFSILAKEEEVDNEVFRKTLHVFSSSNTYYPLIIAAGYFRQVCSNGLLVPMYGDMSFNIKSRHFYKVVGSVQEHFSSRLPFLNNQFNSQMKRIIALKNSDISLQEFAHKLNKSGLEDQEPRKIIMSNLKSLGRKFIDSTSDSLETGSLDELQLNGVTDPSKFLTQPNEVRDVTIEKFKVFNCYTEIFRNRNLACIERENKRVFEVLEQN